MMNGYFCHKAIQIGEINRIWTVLDYNNERIFHHALIICDNRENELSVLTK
jgi:hypothetical protein